MSEQTTTGAELALEYFSRHAAETKATLEQVGARLGTPTEFDGDGPLVAHLRKNLDYYTLRAEGIASLFAEQERLKEALENYQRGAGRGPDDPAGCPGGCGDQCCGHHAACRAALTLTPRQSKENTND